MKTIRAFGSWFFCEKLIVIIPWKKTEKNVKTYICC